MAGCSLSDLERLFKDYVGTEFRLAEVLSTTSSPLQEEPQGNLRGSLPRQKQHSHSPLAVSAPGGMHQHTLPIACVLQWGPSNNQSQGPGQEWCGYSHSGQQFEDQQPSLLRDEPSAWDLHVQAAQPHLQHDSAAEHLPQSYSQGAPSFMLDACASTRSSSMAGRLHSSNHGNSTRKQHYLRSATAQARRYADMHLLRNAYSAIQPPDDYIGSCYSGSQWDDGDAHGLTPCDMRKTATNDGIGQPYSMMAGMTSGRVGHAAAHAHVPEEWHSQLSSRAGTCPAGSMVLSRAEADNLLHRGQSPGRVRLFGRQSTQDASTPATSCTHSQAGWQHSQAGARERLHGSRNSVRHGYKAVCAEQMHATEQGRTACWQPHSRQLPPHVMQPEHDAMEFAADVDADPDTIPALWTPAAADHPDLSLFISPQQYRVHAQPLAHRVPATMPRLRGHAQEHSMTTASATACNLRHNHQHMQRHMDVSHAVPYGTHSIPTSVLPQPAAGRQADTYVDRTPTMTQPWMARACNPEDMQCTQPRLQLDTTCNVQAPAMFDGGWQASYLQPTHALPIKRQSSQELQYGLEHAVVTMGNSGIQGAPERQDGAVYMGKGQGMQRDAMLHSIRGRMRQAAKMLHSPPPPVMATPQCVPSQERNRPQLHPLYSDECFVSVDAPQATGWQQHSHQVQGSCVATSPAAARRIASSSSESSRETSSSGGGSSSSSWQQGTLSGVRHVAARLWPNSHPLHPAMASALESPSGNGRVQATCSVPQPPGSNAAHHNTAEVVKAKRHTAVATLRQPNQPASHSQTDSKEQEVQEDWSASLQQAVFEAELQQAALEEQMQQLGTLDQLCACAEGILDEWQGEGPSTAQNEAGVGHAAQQYNACEGEGAHVLQQWAEECLPAQATPLQPCLQQQQQVHTGCKQPQSRLTDSLSNLGQLLTQLPVPTPLDVLQPIAPAPSTSPPSSHTSWSVHQPAAGCSPMPQGLQRGLSSKQRMGGRGVPAALLSSASPQAHMQARTACISTPCDDVVGERGAAGSQLFDAQAASMMRDSLEDSIQSILFGNKGALDRHAQQQQQAGLLLGPTSSRLHQILSPQHLDSPSDPQEGVLNLPDSSVQRRLNLELELMDLDLELIQLSQETHDVVGSTTEGHTSLANLEVKTGKTGQLLGSGAAGGLPTNSSALQSQMVDEFKDSSSQQATSLPSLQQERMHAQRASSAAPVHQPAAVRRVACVSRTTRRLIHQGSQGSLSSGNSWQGSLSAGKSRQGISSAGKSRQNTSSAGNSRQGKLSGAACHASGTATAKKASVRSSPRQAGTKAGHGKKSPKAKAPGMQAACMQCCRPLSAPMHQLLMVPQQQPPTQALHQQQPLVPLPEASIDGPAHSTHVTSGPDDHTTTTADDHTTTTADDHTITTADGHTTHTAGDHTIRTAVCDASLDASMRHRDPTPKAHRHGGGVDIDCKMTGDDTAMQVSAGPAAMPSLADTVVESTQSADSTVVLGAQGTQPSSITAPAASAVPAHTHETQGCGSGAVTGAEQATNADLCDVTHRWLKASCRLQTTPMVQLLYEESLQESSEAVSHTGLPDAAAPPPPLPPPAFQLPVLSACAADAVETDVLQQVMQELETVIPGPEAALLERQPVLSDSVQAVQQQEPSALMQQTTQPIAAVLHSPLQQTSSTVFDQPPQAFKQKCHSVQMALLPTAKSAFEQPAEAAQAQAAGLVQSEAEVRDATCYTCAPVSDACHVSHCMQLADQPAATQSPLPIETGRQQRGDADASMQRDVRISHSPGKMHMEVQLLEPACSSQMVPAQSAGMADTNLQAAAVKQRLSQSDAICSEYEGQIGKQSEGVMTAAAAEPQLQHLKPKHSFPGLSASTVLQEEVPCTSCISAEHATLIDTSKHRQQTSFMDASEQQQQTSMVESLTSSTQPGVAAEDQQYLCSSAHSLMSLNCSTTAACSEGRADAAGTAALADIPMQAAPADIVAAAVTHVTVPEKPIPHGEHQAVQVTAHITSSSGLRSPDSIQCAASERQVSSDTSDAIATDLHAINDCVAKVEVPQQPVPPCSTPTSAMERPQHTPEEATAKQSPLEASATASVSSPIASCMVELTPLAGTQSSMLQLQQTTLPNAAASPTVAGQRASPVICHATASPIVSEQQPASPAAAAAVAHTPASKPSRSARKDLKAVEPVLAAIRAIKATLPPATMALLAAQLATNPRPQDLEVPLETLQQLAALLEQLPKLAPVAPPGEHPKPVALKLQALHQDLTHWVEPVLRPLGLLPADSSPAATGAADSRPAVASVIPAASTTLGSTAQATDGCSQTAACQHEDSEAARVHSARVTIDEQGVPTSALDVQQARLQRTTHGHANGGDVGWATAAETPICSSRHGAASLSGGVALDDRHSLQGTGEQQAANDVPGQDACGFSFPTVVHPSTATSLTPNTAVSHSANGKSDVTGHSHTTHASEVTRQLPASVTTTQVKDSAAEFYTAVSSTMPAALAYSHTGGLHPSRTLPAAAVQHWPGVTTAAAWPLAPASKPRAASAADAMTGSSSTAAADAMTGSSSTAAAVTMALTPVAASAMFPAMGAMRHNGSPNKTTATCSHYNTSINQAGQLASPVQPGQASIGCVNGTGMTGVPQLSLSQLADALNQQTLQMQHAAAMSVASSAGPSSPLSPAAARTAPMPLQTKSAGGALGAGQGIGRGIRSHRPSPQPKSCSAAGASDATAAMLGVPVLPAQGQLQGLASCTSSSTVGSDDSKKKLSFKHKLASIFGVRQKQ